MRFVVSGGAGFIGSHIVDDLVNNGIETYVVDNFSTGMSVNINPNAVFTEPFDVTQTPDAWLDSETTVIHCAAQPKCNVSMYAPLDDLEKNYLVGINFLVKCISGKVKRFVLVSSNSVYGKQNRLPYTEDMTPSPSDPYAIHKFALEQMCRSLCFDNGVEFVILRPQHVFGIRQRYNLAYRNVVARWIKKAILDQPLPVFGDLTLQRAFSPISLISRAVIAASLEIKANGQIINLGSKNLRSLGEISLRISKLLNKQIEFEYLPAPPTLMTHAYGSVEKMERLLGIFEYPDEFEKNFNALAEDIKNSDVSSKEIGISPELQSGKYDLTYRVSS